MNFKQFLSTKELFYQDIDYDFFPKVWKEIGRYFKVPKIIHIIGTNGKGSTGRFLAYYLYKSGYKVGHYSSPHILLFNERIWKNGKDIDEYNLQKVHQIVLSKIPNNILDKLSYFEYTTLLAIEFFKDCEYIVLEAGLGGEFDATNVFKKLFSLVTPIDIDHQSFLGNSIKEIAKTKLKSVESFAIFSKQKKEIYQIANDLDIRYFNSRDFFTKKELLEIENFIKLNFFATYLKENLILALSAIKSLNIDYDLSRVDGVELKGRFQKIAKNIIIDVGHNKQAALAIKNELNNKKINLIYNTYKDKDYIEILNILKPNIEKVLVIDIDNIRILNKKILHKDLRKLNIPYADFDINMLNDKKSYLVFGSFVVVENFLNMYNS